MVPAHPGAGKFGGNQRTVSVILKVQAVADQAPLDGEIPGSMRGGNGFIAAERGRAMIDDQIGARGDLKTIVGVASIVAAVTGAKMEETHDHVAGFYIDGIILNANAISRRGLAGDGHVGFVEFEAAG